MSKAPAIIRRPAQETWEKRLAVFLREIHLTDESFSGRVVLDFNHGGICHWERTEKGRVG